MKYLVAGPSHTARWKQRISWKQFVQPNNMKYLYFEAAGAIFSKKMEQFIKKHASEVEVIYLLIPDFRFGNNILKERDFSDHLFFDGFIGTNKELISLENDQILYRHAIKVLDYYQKTYGSKIKFVFWCLNYRESQNKEKNKYINSKGMYHHPTWNISHLLKIYSKNMLNITSLQSRIQEFTIDNQGHPSLKGYLLLHHLFRLGSLKEALTLLDSNYSVVNDFLFMETREQLFKVQNYLANNAELYNLDDSSNMVEIGKENWLFLKNDSNNELTQHQGLSLLTNFQLESIDNIWSQRETFFKHLNINLKVLVIPNKRTLYTHYMQPLVPLSKVRPSIQLIKKLKEKNINVINPLKYMKSKVFLGEKLFDKIDTHWNGIGAYRTYEVLFSDDKDVLAEKELEFFKVKGSGDLGGKLTPKYFDERLYFKIKEPKAIEIFDNQVSNKGRIRVFINDNKNLPICMIYGDSFCEIFLPLLAEHYSKLIFIHSTYINYNIVNYFKPKILIVEMVERFIINHPQNDSILYDIAFDILRKYKEQKGNISEIIMKLILLKEEQKSLTVELDLPLSLAYIINDDYQKSLNIIELLIKKMPNYTLLSLIQNILFLKLKMYDKVSFKELFEEMILLSLFDFSESEILNYLDESKQKNILYFLLLNFYLKNNLLDDFEQIKNKLNNKKNYSIYSSYVLGNFYFSKKNYKKSLNYFYDIEKKFNHHDVYFKIGFAHFILRDFEESKIAYYSALKLDVNNYKIYFHLALVYMQLNKFEKAELRFKEALSLEVKDESLFIQMSVLYRKQNNIIKQEECLVRALEINNQNIGALIEYAKLLFLKKEYLKSKNLLLKINHQNDEVKLLLKKIDDK